MRKILVFSLFTLSVFLPAFSYAEVQSIKVSGDIRIKGVSSDNIYRLSETAGDASDYVEQRTHISADADLTDDVSAKVTLQAESFWGSGNEDADGSFDTEVTESYILFDRFAAGNIYLKIGRQYLSFGKGFIFSDRELNYKFDALRVNYDNYPFMVDVILGSVVAPKVNFDSSEISEDRDFYGINAGYEFDRGQLEAYLWQIKDSSEDIAVLRKDFEPLIVGVRGQTDATESLNLWGEFVLENGDLSAERKFNNAYALDLGGKYVFESLDLRPSLKIAYTAGSGDKSTTGDTKAYVPLYDYEYDYGYVYSPELSNIHIVNIALTIEPIVDVVLAFDYYHYRQDEIIAQAMGNIYQDNAANSVLTNGKDKKLGDEIDVSAAYKYSEDVTASVLAGWFKPGSSYSSSNDDTAYEIRGEILVNF